MESAPDRPPDAVTEQLHSLTHEYCRFVLEYFHRQSTETATVEDLGAFIHGRDPQDEQRVTVHLHHVTLPKLAAIGLIDYDPRSNTARYRGRADE